MTNKSPTAKAAQHTRRKLAEEADTALSWWQKRARQHTVVLYTVTLLLLSVSASLRAQSAATDAPDESTAAPIVISRTDAESLSVLQDFIKVDANRRERYEPFRTYMTLRSEAERKLARGEAPLPHFYRYTATKDDTLLAVAARLNLPVETLATANGLQTPQGALTGIELLLPTVPGLFVPEEARTPYELMLKKSHASADRAARYVLDGRPCVFLRNARMNATERAFFLDTSMVMPLEKHVLTSKFGYRISPISGAWKLHSGVDLAAPLGSDVFACKNGTVASAVRMDAVFGNYIILQHTGGMTSVYAHLSKIDVQVGDAVFAGKKIGAVGSTGMSTGPHLHFEVRVNGSATDPGTFITVE